MMRVIIDVFCTLLSVSCILLFCRYFFDEKSLKQYQDQLKNLKTEESTQYSKDA
jgi:hypothetical protein